jgi:hypothetical protein
MILSTGTTPQATCFQAVILLGLFDLKMEAICSSETLSNLNGLDGIYSADAEQLHDVISFEKIFELYIFFSQSVKYVAAV